MVFSKIVFGLANQAYEAVAADVLVVGVFKSPDKKNTSASKTDKKTMHWTPALTGLDKTLNGMVKLSAQEEGFDGSLGKTLTFRKSPSYKIQSRRVVLVGLGEAKKLRPEDWEKAVQKGYSAMAHLEGLVHAVLVLPEITEKLTSDLAIETAVDAISHAVYRSEEAKDQKQSLKKVTLLLSNPATASDKQALRLGEIIASAKSQTKDLVNKPANLKTTDTLVGVARALGKKTNLTATIQSNVAWIEKNMPCFYAVARGSLASDPPKFIQVKYTPKSGRAKKRIAIVGKSVIFDTGGYQVKTGNYMNTMKGDMTGGAVMLGTMAALAELQPEHIEVIAYMAATPNKIDSDAMIPDSIFNTACGKKVEMRHTDAEGRLTLIDAVTKAADAKPDEIITMATLTGSAAQAVGRTIALMGNDEGLVDRVYAAAKTHGEPIQRLDVLEEDYTAIKSKLDGADIINTTHGKGRGAQSAAAFVMSGAPEGIPVAHMDIAGADMTADEKATGIGQKTMIQYLLNENAKLSAGKTTAKPATRSAKPTSKVRRKK